VPLDFDVERKQLHPYLQTFSEYLIDSFYADGDMDVTAFFQHRNLKAQAR
jgi:hypothetical protein